MHLYSTNRLPNMWTANRWHRYQINSIKTVAAKNWHVIVWWNHHCLHSTLVDWCWWYNQLWKCGQNLSQSDFCLPSNHHLHHCNKETIAYANNSTCTQRHKHSLHKRSCNSIVQTHVLTRSLEGCIKDQGEGVHMSCPPRAADMAGHNHGQPLACFSRQTVMNGAIACQGGRFCGRSWAKV